jgi:hypothetical protein
MTSTPASCPCFTRQVHTHICLRALAGTIHQYPETLTGGMQRTVQACSARSPCPPTSVCTHTCITLTLQLQQYAVHGVGTAPTVLARDAVPQGQPPASLSRNAPAAAAAAAAAAGACRSSNSSSSSMQYLDASGDCNDVGVGDWLEQAEFRGAAGIVGWELQDEVEGDGLQDGGGLGAHCRVCRKY